VHGSESAQSVAEQHSRHSLPQSLGVEVAHWQLELEHTAPGLHALPQLPQWAGSLLRSTSQPSPAWALQLAKPVRHDGSPLVHFWFGPTGLLQPPQCCGSVLVSAHELPHFVSPEPQLSTQVVPSQIGAAVVHTVVHVPQCSGSVSAVSQPGLESQFWKPERHSHLLDAQAPFTPQLVPQLPQFDLSVARLASQPSFLLALQSPYPARHAHFPATHCWLAPQLVPQAPQFDLSVARFASQPFATWPSQLAVPAGQVHLPRLQVWSKPHSAPQLPQFAGSTAESTSQPVTAFLSQSRWPSAHVLLH